MDHWKTGTVISITAVNLDVYLQSSRCRAFVCR